MIGLDYAEPPRLQGSSLPGQLFLWVQCARCGTRWHAWLHLLPPPSVPLCWRAPPYLCPHCRQGSRLDDADGGPVLHCYPRQDAQSRCGVNGCPAVPHGADGTCLGWMPRRKSGNVRGGAKRQPRRHGSRAAWWKA
jgi:hypothetical protein